MTEKEKKSLELIAKNLSVCSKRTVEDVLMHLPESKKLFLLDKIERLKR